MQIIPLEALPNQQFNVDLDGVGYDISIYETNGCMSIDVTRAGVVVVQGQRCVAGQLVLPYVSLEGVYGNFAFLTQAGDLPYYDQFTTTQVFMFATTAEIGAIRDGQS